MTTQQIIALARKKLLETGTEILDEETLLIYANLAYKDIARKIFPNSAIKSATVVFVNGVGTLPTDFGTMYADAYSVTGNDHFVELNISDFTRDSGISNAVSIEGGVMRVSPRNTTSLNIKYYPKYEDLEAGGQPMFDDYFDEVIVYGILYRAYEDLQDVELSKFFQTKYDDMIKDKIATLSNYEEDAQRGGTMFNGIRMFGGYNNNNDPHHW